MTAKQDVLSKSQHGVKVKHKAVIAMLAKLSLSDRLDVLLAVEDLRDRRKTKRNTLSRKRIMAKSAATTEKSESTSLDPQV